MLALATSAQVPNKISFYNVVIFIHITAAVLALGAIFAYPLVDGFLHRPGNLRHLGWWHRAQGQIGQKLITPAATVLLLAGIYVAAAAGGEVKFSAEYQAVARRWRLVGTGSLVLVLVAVFVMAVKPS